MPKFLKNYICTSSFIILAYIFYSNNAYYYNFLNQIHKINIWQLEFQTFNIYKIIIIIYLILLIPYYYFNKNINSKALIVFNYFFNKKAVFTNIQKQAILTLLVKFFFVPIMINWLLWHIAGMINNTVMVFINSNAFNWNFINLFNQYLFNSLLQLILFLDVLFFTIGYIIEMPRLKNQIVSVEPTIFGWVVCLACYPPFNSSVTNIIGWSSSDFPKFINPGVHIFFNSLILIFMWIYTLASVSLNFKASNLTNRWIVIKWPYRIVRHPAYISKNLAWWIWGIPFIAMQFNKSFIGFILAILSLILWSCIYYLRAITEEKHLLLWNNWYKEYCQKVKYRFIPWFF